MSLIEEALRRVQDPTVPTAQAPAPAQPKPRPEGIKPAHPWPTTPAVSTPPPFPAQPTTNALVAVAVAIFALTGILVLWGAFWIGRVLGTPPAVSTATPPEPAPTTPPVAAPAPSHPEPVDEHPDAAAPPQRPVQQAAAEPALALNGVVEGLGAPYAMINGAIVGVGESVEDSVVLEITNGSVRLRRGDGTESVLRVTR